MKVKTFPSAEYIIDTIFGDFKEIFFIQHLSKGQTINGAYYVTPVDKPKVAITEKKTSNEAMKKVLFHHNNALRHISHIVREKLVRLYFQVVHQLAYIPDLAPLHSRNSNCFLPEGNLRQMRKL